MKHSLFSDRCKFMDYQFTKYRHTDAADGANMHFLAVVEEGTCRLVSKKTTVELQAGDAFYIPLGIPYHSYWYGKPNIRFLSFGFTMFPEAVSVKYAMQKLPSDEITLSLLRAIPRQRQPDSNALAKLYTALSHVLPHMRYDDANSAEVVLENAKHYMIRHPEKRIPDVAKYCCISASRLYAIFKEVAGVSPNEYRQELLCKQAEDLLITTDRSIQDISDCLNFSSPSYFRKILRKYTGKTPREIRKEAVSV